MALLHLIKLVAVNIIRGKPQPGIEPGPDDYQKQPSPPFLPFRSGVACLATRTCPA
jgi:hypothetical protein